MARSEQEKAAEMMLCLEALWETGKTMLTAYAHDMSKPMPPLPDWVDLPWGAKVAFGQQAYGPVNDLMKLVEGISARKSQIEQGG